MNNREFIPGDNDIIDMVGKNRACHPGGEPMILMKKQEAMALLMKATPKRPRRYTQEEEITREKLMLQLGHVAAPVCIGMTWILGAVEGLADPAFACVITGISILWGCVEWKWGKLNA